MNRVEFTPDVRHYFKTLIPVLYRLGYFSYLEGSRKYVKRVVDDILDTLPARSHRHAPARFRDYGKGLLYASFRRNRTTTWYAFFTRHEGADGETVYIVRHIANNHTVARYM